jgi:hypothetical protein
MSFQVVPDSPYCPIPSGGFAVAVVSAADDGTIIHDSCHLTVAEAEAWIGQMDNPDVDLTAEALPPEVPEIATNSTSLSEFANREQMLTAMLTAVLAGAIESTADQVSTQTENAVPFGAISCHPAELSEESFSSPAAKATRIISPNSEEYFARIFAWRDVDANTEVKSSYKFRHHFVEEDGTPGAASRIACSGGISVLNGGGAGTTIPEDHRQSVYDHLAGHLRDAGRECIDLLSQDAYEAALARSNEAALAISNEVVTVYNQEGKNMTESFDMHEGELEDDLLETQALEPVELEEGQIVVNDGDMSGITDDELMAELARRWAETTVAGLSPDDDIEEPMAVATAEDAEAFGNPVIEVELEVTQIEAEVEVESGDMGECEHEEEHECDCPIVVSLPAGKSIVIEACDDEEGEHGGGYEDGYGEAMMAADGTTLAEEPEMIQTPVTLYDWEGVLIVEGIASGDGRKIAENALTWRELPLPLMLQTANASGHDGAVIAGSIHEIERQGQNIVGRGFFDSGSAGVEAHRLLKEGTMRGVSADIDSVMVEFLTADGGAVDAEDMLFGGVDALEVLVAGRLMGATLTPFPAFQEAFVTVLIGDEVEIDVALVASGSKAEGDVWRVPSPLGAWLPGEKNAEEGLAALVASAAASVEVPANPPMEWFLPGNMTGIEPFTVHPDGRCYGLVAAWGSCHIGFADRCVPVPKSGCAYKHFRNKNVLTAEGTLVASGPIYMDTVHPNLRLVASDSQAFYADTGCAVADVALYENEFGIVAAGALRPGLSAEQVRRFRGSDVSPDWRQLGGRLEVVGLLSVNVSGFIVESLVASGAELSAPRGVWDSVAGEVTALVAAGMIHTADTEKSDMRRELNDIHVELAEFREALRPVRAAAAAAKFAAVSAVGGVESSCSCDTVR